MASDPSFVRGADTPPLIDSTIGGALELAARRWPDREAIVACESGTRLTYAQLDGCADEFAAGLLALGIKPGERIGLWSPNCAEWAITQYAAAKAGLILVNINPAYRKHELEFVLNKVGCAVLVTASQFKSSNYIGMLCELAPELRCRDSGHLAAAKLPFLKWVIGIDHCDAPAVLPFQGIAERALDSHRHALREISAGLKPEQAVNIQFTSGTTGSPKGATLTHRNVLNNGFFVGEAIRTGVGDRICVPVPLYHCFGMCMGNLNCLTHGATAIYPARGFDALATLQCIQEERCTALYGVPTMFIAMLDHPQFDRYTLSSLRGGIMAGSPCPIAVMQRVVDAMHMPEVTIAYGMTETSPVSFQSGVDDSLEHRVATVGRIQPHLQVKLISGDGSITPRGATGELCTRGYSVMQGYWGEPERTAEVLDSEGWMHTGDLAVIDAQGYCNIVGRIKDMVIRGGENIYPREVEEFLFKHPKIQGVACFGVPDARFGEELCAWIQLRPGATAAPDEIRQFCDGEIAHYKIPHYIEFVNEFPLTVTGKIQKFIMRDVMVERLGLKVEPTA
ncbi:MAG: fatty-acyl-CoA synthase [Gammaproteobacteria bacterium]|nr:fatty-acyl-CoA synthase [Gammaproteobacteria bacterium]